MKRLELTALALAIGTAVAPRLAAAMTDGAVVDRAYHAVVAHRLASRPDCVSFAVTRNVRPGVDEIDVREVHNRRCGGDPIISPLVLTLRIDERRNLVAKMDVATGKFRLLK